MSRNNIPGIYLIYTYGRKSGYYSWIYNVLKFVSYGHQYDFENDYYLQSDGSFSVLEHINYIKNSGITYDCKLNCVHHIKEKVNKSYAVLGLLFRNFKYMSFDTFVMLYHTLVRSYLGYANFIWSPCRQMDIEKMGKVRMKHEND